MVLLYQVGEYVAAFFSLKTRSKIRTGLFVYRNFSNKDFAVKRQRLLRGRLAARVKGLPHHLLSPLPWIKMDKLICEESLYLNI